MNRNDPSGFGTKNVGEINSPGDEPISTIAPSFNNLRTDESIASSSVGVNFGD